MNEPEQFQFMMDPNRIHQADPLAWTESELRRWLEDNTEEEPQKMCNLSKSQMIAKVNTELDIIHSNMKVHNKKIMKYLRCFSSLPQWPDYEGTNIVSGLKRDFCDAISDGKPMTFLPNTIKNGWNPVDDFILNQIVIVQTLDTHEKDNIAFVFQDVEQDHGLILLVKEIFFFPQNNSIEANTKVVLHGSDCPFRGEQGTVNETDESEILSTGCVQVCFEKTRQVVAVKLSNILVIKADTSIQLGSPPVGSLVVISGLVKNQTCNGLLGRIIDIQAERSVVKCVNQPTLLVRPANLTWVETPINPVLLVIYTSYDCPEAARNFIEQNALFWQDFQAPRIVKHNTRCITRELLFFQKTLVEASRKLSPEIAAKFYELYSPAFWTVSILAPSVPAPSKREVERKALIQKSRVCSNCTQAIIAERSNCCSRCLSVFYCSKQCQRQHWKAKHKKVCTNKNIPSSSQAENSCKLDLEPSIIVPMMSTELSYDMLTGKLSPPGQIPKNRYGAEEFLVKLNNGSDFSNQRGHKDPSFGIEDKVKTFSIQTGNKISPTDYQTLFNLMKENGRNGRVCGKVLYLPARREGSNLVIVHGRRPLPSQQYQW